MPHQAARVLDAEHPCTNCGNFVFNTVRATGEPRRPYTGRHGVKMMGSLNEYRDCLICGNRELYYTRRAGLVRIVHPVREAVVQSLKMRVRIR